MRFYLAFSLLVAMALPAHGDSTGISNSTLALIVNDSDPQSLEVASYYSTVREIPAENIIHTRFNHRRNSLSANEFARVEEQVRRQVPEGVQAYALTWTRPYKVECMSITSAFALGFDRDYCAKGCKPTRRVPYYNSQSEQPYRDFGIRPTMMLAGRDAAEVRKLIDRGAAADLTRPGGRAYLVSTSDRNRNVRAATYPFIARSMSSVLDIEIVEADYIENRPDVMFYFTGMKAVEKLKDNRFLPGSIADHLTSAGGALFGERQMSALEWLEAGAAGSYGTVTEPCNFPAKFPHPGIVLRNYLDGRTLIEAYWKSVAMPGQGIFIGEPLTSPYKGCRISMTGNGSYRFDNYGEQLELTPANRKCR